MSYLDEAERARRLKDGQSQLWEGTIVATPGPGEGLSVVLPGYDPDTAYGPMPYSPRTDALPMRGMDCLVAISSDDDFWCVLWWPGSLADAEVSNGIRSGHGSPSAGLGRDGDYYLDEDTDDLYGPKDTTWGSPTNLKGPQGDAGPPGPDGAKGAKGDQGDPGPSTPKGLCKILRVGAHNLAVGWNPIQFDTTMYNMGGIFTPHLGVIADIQINEAGDYTLSAGWAINAAANNHYGALHINGGQRIVEGGEGVFMSPFRHMQETLFFSAGDKISMQIYCSNTATTLIGTHTWIQAKRERF